MLTYHVRRRMFRLTSGAELNFPALCVIRFNLSPDQAFGITPEGGRTAVRAKPATAYFDANTGRHSIVSAEPLKPLAALVESPGCRVQLRGTTLEIDGEFAGLQSLEDFILKIYFALPFLLNVRFADPPVVLRVDGEINGIPFRWELADWKMEFLTTTQEQQEESFVRAWIRLDLFGDPPRRRLLAALHYFYVATRLDRSANAPGEFMSEALLNLAKVLEVLFPPGGDGKTRDAARRGLRQLGYSNADIERLFLPAMALRNELDVGHASLALLTRSQLSVIHAYTEVAETAFREMLNRVVNAVVSGKMEIVNGEDSKPSQSVLKLIQRLATQFKTGGS
jgi:hypothetical protein